jgi:hypothetical protein
MPPCLILHYFHHEWWTAAQKVRSIDLVSIEPASFGPLLVNALINNYNARPTWLDLTHKKLDAAVAAAYGWPADLADEKSWRGCWP